MSEINLNMPGGPYPYPTVTQDEDYMNSIEEVKKQFEAAGDMMQEKATEAMPTQPVVQQPATPLPVAPQPAAPQPMPPAPQLPVVAPAEKPKAAKKAPKASPKTEPVQDATSAQVTLETIKTNFAADMDNLKADWEDILKIVSAKPEASAEEVETLNAEISSLKVQNETLEKENQKLKEKLDKAIKSFLEG